MKHVISYDAYVRGKRDDYDWVGRSEEVSTRRLKGRLREIDMYIMHRFLQVDGKFIYGSVEDEK